jgi:hypothetical protein
VNIHEFVAENSHEWPGGTYFVTLAVKGWVDVFPAEDKFSS